jgi:hypothetical protein
LRACRRGHCQREGRQRAKITAAEPNVTASEFTYGDLARPTPWTQSTVAGIGIAMPNVRRESLVARIAACMKALAYAEDDLWRANATLMIRFLNSDLAELGLQESPSALAAHFCSVRSTAPSPTSPTAPECPEPASGSAASSPAPVESRPSWPKPRGRLSLRK